jgi:hypothetical protein
LANNDFAFFVNHILTCFRESRAGQIASLSASLRRQTLPKAGGGSGAQVAKFIAVGAAAFVSCLQALPAFAQNAIGALSTPFVVEDIIDDGVLVLGQAEEFSGNGGPHTRFVKLWGVEPDVVFLRELIKGKVVFCSPGGGYFTRAVESGEVQTCWLPNDEANPDARFVRDIAGLIIALGRGNERCRESENFYRRCK